MHVVLVVDDQIDIAEVMQTVLAHEGCEAHAVYSREEALDFIMNKCVPDTVLMDWHMPGMTLELFLAALKQFKVKIPRMVLTTAAHDADSAARRYDIQEVLRKPFRMERLLEQVDCSRA